MKVSYLLFLCIFIAFNLQAQKIPSVYDSTLAASLGADDYGMKEYVLVILKKGTANIADKSTKDSLMMGHMTNMETMAKAGQLVVAGPLGENDKGYRGIFIFNTRTIEEARKIADSDPAIHAGIFDVELYPWYGSAALIKYLDFHPKIQKKGIME